MKKKTTKLFHSSILLRPIYVYQYDKMNEWHFSSYYHKFAEVIVMLRHIWHVVKNATERLSVFHTEK